MGAPPMCILARHLRAPLVLPVIVMLSDGRVPVAGRRLTLCFVPLRV